MNYRGGFNSFFEAFGSTQIQSTLGEKKSRNFTVFNKPRSKTGLSVQNFIFYSLYKRETVSWRG